MNFKTLVSLVALFFYYIPVVGYRMPLVLYIG